jgi:hypothetical protein
MPVEAVVEAVRGQFPAPLAQSNIAAVYAAYELIAHVLEVSYG